MKWTKMALTTTTEAEDLVINLLSELGIDGVEISDNVPITEEEKKKIKLTSIILEKKYI